MVIGIHSPTTTRSRRRRRPRRATRIRNHADVLESGRAARSVGEVAVAIILSSMLRGRHLVPRHDPPAHEEIEVPSPRNRPPPRVSRSRFVWQAPDRLRKLPRRRSDTAGLGAPGQVRDSLRRSRRTGRVPVAVASKNTAPMSSDLRHRTASRQCSNEPSGCWIAASRPTLGAPMNMSSSVAVHIGHRHHRPFGREQLSGSGSGRSPRTRSSGARTGGQPGP